MVGQSVGNYRIIRLLAEGAMGAVYEAEHPTIRHRVAIKVLHQHLCGSPVLVERFLSEARVVNDIGHPHIVSVRDLGQTAEGRHYLTMEFLEGESLRQRMARQRPLPLAAASSIAQQTADALGAAHAQGAVHRDVKPDNIFLTRQTGVEDFVKVLDFGIAKLVDRQDQAVQTEKGTVLGTPEYMSPEQCAGKTADHRSDVYSLGVVLFEMATGQRPFGGDGIGFVLMDHLKTPPPAPRSIVPGIPESFEAVILRALEKKPNDRFQSMDEFRRAVEAASQGLPVAVELTVASKDRPVHTTLTRSAVETLTVQAPSHRARRRRRLALGAGGLVAAAVAVALFGWGGDSTESREEPAAETEVSAGRPPVRQPVEEAAEPTNAAPSPRKAKLMVVSDPEGADIFLPGSEEPVGQTPQEIEVDPGPLDVTIRKGGYESRTESVRAGQEPGVRVTLTEIPKPRPRKETKPTPKAKAETEAESETAKTDANDSVPEPPPPKPKHPTVFEDL